MKINRVLAKGITGFCDFDVRDFNFIDYELFKTKCYQFARQMNGEVIYMDDDEYTIQRNFRIAKISISSFSFKEEIFEVFVNLYYPIIGLAKGRESEELDTCFIDFEEAKNFFKDDYLVLSKQQLEDHFDCMSRELNQILYMCEIKQIRYWKPQKLSEVIFNYWD